MAQDVTLSVGGDFGPLDKQAQQALKRLQRTFEKTGKAGSKSTHALGSGLSAATAKANEFEKSMNAAYARVIAFGASAGVIVKVQQAFNELVKSTIEVEKSLKDINVILGASAKGLERFSSGLFKVAKDTGQTFETVAAAATELSRQGLSAEKTLQRTKDAMILARLAGMDAVGAVEALTATLNTFNKSGLDSTKVVNKLAKVDAAFAVSSEDLAQALQRVGASAQGAGVSFDELLAVVTAAQQKTARGGAVIGNSFKTIFTRIQRPEVLNQLERIGVAVRDLQGNTLPAIRILDGLARTFDTLSDSQKSIVSEQVAGVFQINILKAALGDLNSEYSIYQGALRASASATNEAIQRNAELNKTVSALLNQAAQAFKEFGAVVGGATIAPAIRNILTPLTAGLEAITTAAGTDMGKAILDGLGRFISGPGLAVVGLITGKLLAQFASFAKEALQVFTGRNTAALQTKNVEQDILAIMRQQLATQRQMGAGRGRSRGRVGNFALATTPVRAGGEGMIPNFSNGFETMRPADLRRMAAGKRNPENVAGAKAELAKRGLPLQSKTASKNYIATGLSGRIGVLTGIGANTERDVKVNLSSLTSPKTRKLKEQGYQTVTVPKVKYRTAFQKDQEAEFSDLINNPTMKSAIGSIASNLSYQLFEPREAGLLQRVIKKREKSVRLDAGAEGAVFEAASRMFLGTGTNPFSNLNQQAAFDFEEGRKPKKLFRDFFNFGEGLVRADAKRSGSNIASGIVNKTFNDSGTARLGYPNFSALSEAIAREKAAGIPAGAIRVGRSSQLASASNPQGLAVYNTIDEPRGLSQGINRYKSAGLDPRAAGMPNFAANLPVDAQGYVDITPAFKEQEEAQKANTKAIEESNKLEKEKKLEARRTRMGRAGGLLSTAGYMMAGGLDGEMQSILMSTLFGAGMGGGFLGLPGAIAGGTIGAFQGISEVTSSSRRGAQAAVERDLVNQEALNLISSGVQEGNESQIIEAMSQLDPEIRAVVEGFGELDNKTIAFAKSLSKSMSAIDSIGANLGRQGFFESGFMVQTMDSLKMSGEFLKGAFDDLSVVTKDFVSKIPFMEEAAEAAGEALKTVGDKVKEAAGIFTTDKMSESQINRIKAQGEQAALSIRSPSVDRPLSLADFAKANMGDDKSSLRFVQEFFSDKQYMRGFAAQGQGPELGQAMMVSRMANLAKDLGVGGPVGVFEAKTTAFAEGLDEAIKNLDKIRQTTPQKTADKAKTGYLNDFLEELRFSGLEKMHFLRDSVVEVGKTMKSSFKDGFKSFIDGSKNASEAFRSFANTILDKLLDISLDYGTNSLFSALGAGINLGTKTTKFGFFESPVSHQPKARGGMVTGGSGVRDDVPAMLTGGEYVVKKSAVDALGVGFMNRINSYAEGGVVGANQFQMGTLGTRGKFNVSSRLSSLAITSTSNPQTALRSEMAQADEQRVTRYQEYIERKRQAMAAFKAQKRQRRIGAVMNAALILGASALGNRKRKMGTAILHDLQGPLMEDGSFHRPDTPTPLLVPTGRAQGGSMSTSIAPVKPMGTSASASPMSFVGGGGGGAAAMLAASIQQLSASIQSGGSAGGGETSVNLTFNIDKSGNTKSEQNTEKKTGQPSSTEDQEKEKQFGEMIKSVVLDTITQQKRPGGLLFKAN